MFSLFGVASVLVASTGWGHVLRRKLIAEHRALTVVADGLAGLRPALADAEAAWGQAKAHAGWLRTELAEQADGRTRRPLPGQ